jgi:predicted nucleic acid-binding Zn ribbon protein
MQEAKCLVCGNPLDVSAWFGVNNCNERASELTGAENEVCSDECLEVYTEEQ